MNIRGRRQPENGKFATTHWSVVLAAGHASDAGVQHAAASAFCETYWYPVYAFLRREGVGSEQAADLTQGFFFRLLEKHHLADVEEGHGLFRSWLLSAVKHYVSDQRDSASALKRGGGRRIISLDTDDAERRYQFEPAHDLTPERLFHRKWALGLLDRVLADLRIECRRDGKEQLFDLLKDCLAGRPDDGRYAAAADALGLSEAAVRMAAHRLRSRYRELLRHRIAETVHSPEQIDQEIQFLFDALR
jgi:RNA polymerase sigma-70 factor (ECF subfamily)